MKRKNIFIAAAFIFAIGSAFTTRPTDKRSFTLINGYLRASCTTVALQCNGMPGTTCKVGSFITYLDEGVCNTPLTRSIP
jgi:hypothetical protein